jgi:hypothetical protein
MTPKSAAILVVLVETAKLRWFAAALEPDGRPTPLLRAEEGDLAKYRSLPFDEQVAFLRHRFCGVLQRGSDRLWARGLKACRFAFVFEGLVPDATGELTQAVADHFTLWMVNPPAVVFNSPDLPPPGQPARLDRLAGPADPPLDDLLRTHLAALRAAQADPAAWELSPKKP